jgi:LysM repeat protein
MSCQVQINSINQLRRKGVIDNTSQEGANKILNFTEFNSLNEKYTKFAKLKYANVGPLNGDLLFSVETIKNANTGKIEYWSVPNRELFDTLQREFDKSKIEEVPQPKPQFMRTEADRPKTRLASTLYELMPGISKEKIKEIYNNYVNLMDRARKGKAVSITAFTKLLNAYQVYNYKDTYIFGNWDSKNGVFITRMSSSPTSKELLAEAIPNLVGKGLNFISFVPKDVADKYARSGYIVSKSAFEYDFKGESMAKYAAIANPEVSYLLFGKKLEEVSSEEIKNYDKSVELKYTPLEVDASLIKEAGKDTSKILETYLSQFGITIKDIDEIKDKMGIDEFGFADILSKIAYVKNKKDIPPVAGEFIAYMMQHNSLVKDIIVEISGVREKDAYKKLDKSQYFKVIGQLISNDLQNKVEGNYSKNLFDLIRQLINKFFDLFRKVNVDLINKNIGIITTNILQQNKKLVSASLYKPGAFGKAVKGVSMEEALKKDKFGASIINKLTKQGFILTGSTALSEQGIILRPDENPLHDIDWVSPFNREETISRFLNTYPKAIKVRDIIGDGYVTDSYIIAPENHTVEDLVLTDYVDKNGVTKIIISSYKVADKNGNIVGIFQNVNGKEYSNGVEAKVIDFFSYDDFENKNTEAPFQYVTKDGEIIQLSNWKDIFAAKLAWARYKDIWDYNRFIPDMSKDTDTLNAFGIPLIDINLDTLKDSRSKQVAKLLIQKISTDLNVPYQIITAEQAAAITKVSPTPYNGEPAFYYAGTVYVVGDNVNINTVLHEFSHPVINAIRMKNKKLFDNLYNSLINTDEGKIILNNVAKNYPQLLSNEDMFRSEVLTYGLQMASVNKLTNQIQTEGFQSVINKILAAIKDFFRKIFGNKKNISSIDVDTTLDELGNMLLEGEISLEEYDLTEDDLVQYGKFVTERADELTQSLNGEAMEKIVNEWFSSSKLVLDRAQNFTTDAATREMLVNSIFKKGTTDLLPEAVATLKDFQTITDFKKFSKDQIMQEVLNAEEDRLKQEYRRARALVNSIDKVDLIVENMLGDLGKIYREKNINARNTIALITLYQNNSFAWKEAIDQLNNIIREGGFTVDKNNLFYSTINKINSNLDEVRTLISQIYKKNNVQFYVEITGYMNEFVTSKLKENLGIAFKQAYPQEGAREAAVEDFYNKVIDQKDVTDDLQKLYNKGVPESVLTRFLDQYKQFIVSPERIQNALTGHARDVSWFNRFLESYSSSNDIIVGPLSIFIQNQRTEIMNEFMDQSAMFMRQLEKLLPQVNFSKLNVLQIQEMVSFEDTIMYFDKKTGKPIKRTIRTFLNEFGNGYRYEEDILEYNLAEARSLKDQTKIAKAREELRQFRKDYMWQEFVPEFYETDKIYDEIIEGYDAETSKKIAIEAYSDRENALADYNNLTNEHDDELSRFEHYEEIRASWQKYKALTELNYEDGTPKQDDPEKGIYDLSKAKLLLKVSKAKSKFYEFVPLEKSVQTAYNEFINGLAADNIFRGDPEFTKKLRQWEKQNLKIVFDPKYKERRTYLTTRLNELQSKMNLSFDISGAYKQINDLIYVFRDEQGQPIAPELGEEKLKLIRDLEQKIIDFRESLDKKSGLTQEELSYLNTLLTITKRGSQLTDEQNSAMLKLLQKQSATGLTAAEAAELRNIFMELGDLSEKIPTDYYMDALNFNLSRLNIKEVTEDDVDEYINSDEFEKLLEEDATLKEWFEVNHIVKKKKDQGGNTYYEYQRTVANSITVPTNKDYILKTNIIDNETNEEITLYGRPNARHSRYQVRNEFRTIPIGESWNKYVGIYVDNKGNFLPRKFDPSNKYSAKDAKFINQKYFDLKRSNNPQYKLLEEMKKFHLSVQKGQSNYSKLYLDLPRFELRAGDFFQAMQRGKLGERFKTVKEWGKQLVGKSITDFSRGYNYNAENNLVNTDLKGNEISYIPVEGIYNLELDNTDADVISGLFRYGNSIKTQGKLLESLPLVESIVNTLQDPANQPKNLDAFSKGLFNLRGTLKNPTKKGGVNNRLGQVVSLMEREYFGKQTASFEETNPRLAKWLDQIQGLSTRASLAVNIPSDIKNQFSGYVQSIIESIGGEFVTTKDYALAIPWATQAMLTWASKDAYAIGPGSLSGQIIQRFDPTFSTEDKFGQSVTKSIVKDLFNGSWMYAHRKFGEMDVAVKLFASFLHGTKVTRIVNGKETFIRYVDAFELDENGIIKLKDGVDVSWDTKSTFHIYKAGETLNQIAKKYNITVEELKKRNNIESEIQFEDGQEIIISKSEKFKAFKNRMQGVSRRLFGAYDRFGQAEGNKFIIYRMFFFMRKWFTPMLVNRWGFDSSTIGLTSGGERYDWALGKYTKGYYISAFQTLVRLLKSRGSEYAYLTDEEKADARRAMGEAMMVILLALIATMLLGFDPDDDDKWDKIKKRSGAINEETYNTFGFLTNHMLLLALGVQSETTAFIPLPSVFGINMGADDYVKMLTSTSTSWYNTVVLYVQILGDVLNFITFDEADRYEKDTGPYWWQKEGSLKFWKRAFSTVGFTGGTGDPSTVLKNFQNSSTRYGGN